MRKSACVLAVLAAAVSTSAVAKDLKQDTKAPAPTIAAQMSDAEMDKVTAAGNAFGHQGPEAWQFNNGNGPKGLALGHLK